MLCEAEPESINHLFFRCSFSTHIWQKILTWLNIYRKPAEWDEETNSAVTNCRGKQPKVVVYRVALAATVYLIWQERNQRIFQAKAREAKVIVRQIVQDAHTRGRIHPRMKTVLQYLNFYPL